MRVQSLRELLANRLSQPSGQNIRWLLRAGERWDPLDAEEEGPDRGPTLGVLCPFQVFVAAD